MQQFRKLRIHIAVLSNGIYDTFEASGNAASDPSLQRSNETGDGEEEEPFLEVSSRSMDPFNPNLAEQDEMFHHERLSTGSQVPL
ncbi:hypothetical protein GUITHDRAFT_114088 [Guillardia theta CCMP2712]|uniref:Uncharacterized protein n=1 Tax=Guillardia theta (strain CCMP2712) TaxID=905079 RepID=L1IUE4_GUITC|nr:hypothetical protein GUITHDRAFT_114088 [Guillardia theta CCMP2712]EKX39838.1 hypothetical protein GUITHDRAFT_114088 [Guillardia theta CCMP2712]|eukprot:XP_005826818.1 hypothetical protein GUITHDRAFT_114088 [Guillardia theta CCMP2712]